MTATTTQELTLRLPKDLIDMVRKAAQERLETPDAIVAEALQFSLQPLRQEALRRLKSHVRQQQAQSEPEIRAHLDARLTPAEEQRLSQLLELNRTDGLTPEQRAEMQALFDGVEAVATEKAAALWLLSDGPPNPNTSP